MGFVVLAGSFLGEFDSDDVSAGGRPRAACRSLEFHRAAEVIDVAHELAANALDSIADPGLAVLEA